MADLLTVNGLLLNSENSPLGGRRVVATPRPQKVIVMSGESVSLGAWEMTEQDGTFSITVVKAPGTIYGIQTKPERRFPAGIELRCNDHPPGAVIDLMDLPMALPPGVIPGQTVEEVTVLLQTYIDANLIIPRIGIPFSDTRASVTVGIGTMVYPNETGRMLSIVGVGVDVTLAPSGSPLVVDVMKNGVSIFTNPNNRPSISTGQFAGFATTIDSPAFAPNDLLRVDIVAIGSGTAGGHLTVTTVVQG